MKRALVQTTGVDKNSNSQQVLIKTVTVIYPELELPQPRLNVRGEGGIITRRLRPDAHRQLFQVYYY